MRGIALLLAGLGLASCSTTALQPNRSAQAEQDYQRLLAGKVAGPPVACLSTFRANDMVIIDENTVAFKRGHSEVYVNHIPDGCSNLGMSHYALVTRQQGTSLCRGDIAQVMDLTNGMTVGSCSMGDFIPYKRMGA
jgi:hypothetical protein